MSILLIDDGSEVAERLWALLKPNGYRRKRLKLSSIERGSIPSDRPRLSLYPHRSGYLQEIQALQEKMELKKSPVLLYSAHKLSSAGMRELLEREHLGWISPKASDEEIQLQLQFTYHLQKKIDFLQLSESHWHETAALLKEMNNQLEELSNIDPLTTLSNRRHFSEVLEVEWKRALRHQAPISILMVDLDHFKKFNDEYGHLAGDDCLQQVSAALKAQLRRPADLLARYGGEEFIVLLPQTEEAGAAVVADALRRAIEGLSLESGGEELKAQMTASVGVASLVPGPEVRPEALVERADEALYAAKEAGRNRVVMYSESLKRQREPAS